MTPFASTTASQAALSTVHDSLSKLRTALRECVTAQAPQAPSATAPSTSTKPSPASVAPNPHTQELLVQAVVTKVAYADVTRSVDQARRTSQADLAMLQRLQQRHASLRYERALLKNEIAEACATLTPALHSLPIALPPAPTGADVHDAARRAHADTLARLEEELNKRRELRANVETVLRQAKTRRNVLATTKDELRSLPSAVAKLRATVEPVRKLLHMDANVAASPSEVAQIRTLPAPLYVLTREAFAFRTMFPGVVDVSMLTEVGSDDGLYRIHPRRVCIDVKASDAAGGQQAMLQVLFAYHPELHVITVKSRVVEGEAKGSEFDGKGLQLLFPYDVGESSPNACNAHLEEGAFKFDASKVDGARPYVWANLVCGLPCLKRFESVNDIAGSGWPAKAAGHEEHVRFKEIVSALHSRLLMELALRRQTDVLQTNRLPINATELGFAAEPRATLESFVPVVSEDWETIEGLRSDGVNIMFKEVWCMVAGEGTVKVKCVVGVGPNYPTGPPMFRVRCESEEAGMTEQDVLKLEYEVNMFAMEGPLQSRREWLLCGQILTLLTGLDEVLRRADSKAKGDSPGRTRATDGRARLPASLARLIS